MALSVKDYKEIISLTKQIKEEEKELARLKRDGKEIDKAKLENLKAQLEVRRKNNEEAESEYKSTEKAYKSASNLSKKIVGNSDDLLKRKKLISQYDKGSSDIQLQAADALRKSADFEDTILKTKTKSNMLNFNSKEMIEEINEQLEVINSQYEDASDTQKVILANTMEDLDLTKEKVKTLGKQADKVKGQKAAHDKLKELSGGYLDNIEASILMIKEMGKAIAKNPTMAFTALGVAAGQAFEYGISRVKDMQQDIGLARDQALKLRKEFNDFNVPFIDRFAIGADFYSLLLGTDAGKSAASLANEFGHLGVASEQTNEFVQLMEKGLMMSNETTSKLLANFMMVRGESIETAQDSIKLAGALAIANKIPVNTLMKDLSENTETFAEFSIQGSDNIQRAAVQARRLGLNLSTTAKIANSLLDFESSIEKEMSASLLVGKQLNYNRARQLALEGNIAGATQDVMSQLGGQAGFARLNVIQRRALAESIGVSVEELSRLASGKVELKSPDVESREALKDSIDRNTNMLDNILSKSGKAVGGTIGAMLSMLVGAFGDLFGGYMLFRGFGSMKEAIQRGGFFGKGGLFSDMKGTMGAGQDKYIGTGVEDRYDDLARGGRSKIKVPAGMSQRDYLDYQRVLEGKAPRQADFAKRFKMKPDGTPDMRYKLNQQMVGQSTTPPTTPKGSGSKIPKSLRGMKGKGGVLAIATEGYFLANELSDSTLSTRDKTKTIVDSATGLGGAYAGAATGAALGAKGGAFIGSFFGPGVGTAIGAAAGSVLGGIGGGIAGYFGGEKIGGAAFDYGAEVLDARTEQKETTDILTKSDVEQTDRVVESIDLLNMKMNEVKQEIQNLNPQRQ